MTDQQTARWGVRSIVSLLVFILATILVVPALVGHWGHRTVIDSERYIQTVGPLIEQPEVQAALTEAVTEAVIAKVDTQDQISGLLGNLFPNAGFTDQLAGPIASGINSLIGQLVEKFIASPQFETVWIGLNEAAQKGIVAILEGKDGGVVSLQGDEIVLDTSVALAAIQQHLVESGISAAANITIPETDREVVLATAPALAQIRLIYSFTSPILQWLPLIVAALFALAIALARRRARVVVAMGIVLVVSGAVMLLGIGAGEDVLANQLSGSPWAAASSAFFSTLLDYLVAGTQAIVALGVVLIVAGWFGGRTRSAATVRGHVTTGLAELGGRLSSGRPGPLPQDKQAIARWVIYALGALILLFSNLMVVSTVLWVTALVAGLVTLAQLLAGSADSAAGEPTTTSIPLSGSTTSE